MKEVFRLDIADYLSFFKAVAQLHIAREKQAVTNISVTAKGAMQTMQIFSILAV